jgi:toxin secretion/phage lysis holin
MENQHVISFYGSLFATFFSLAYGPDAIMLTGLLVLMVADYVTGIAASIVDRGLCSKIGFRGLLKKFVVLIIIAVTHHLDRMLGTESLMLGALYFYFMQR